MQKQETPERLRPPGKGPAQVTGKAPAIFTIGHSTHSWPEFLEWLKAHGIKRLVDVRTIPRSRHNPQFAREALASELRRARIAYTHIPDLGGLRRPLADSPNTGWRNASFRGYADYMQTRDFRKGLSRLLTLAKHRTCAMMCAEAVPWRCHRSLIADALTIRKVPVLHITSRKSARPHQLTAFAKVRGLKVTYPPAPSTPSLPF